MLRFACNVMVWFRGEEPQFIETYVSRCYECRAIADIYRALGAMSWSECFRDKFF